MIRINLNETGDDISKLIQKLNTTDDELNGWVKETLKVEVDNLVTQLQEGYNYGVSDKSTNDVNVGITPLKNGWKVVAYGEDLYRREFGTGQKGVDNPYPDKNILAAKNWKYGSGEQVIQDYTYINKSSNSSFEDLRIPMAYERAVESGKISEHDFAWLGPYGISKGITPKHIWYDLWTDYEWVDEDNEEFSTITGGLSHKTLSTWIRQHLD